MIYFIIESYRKNQWVRLFFDDYDDGIGYNDEGYAREWLKLYPNRKWRIVKVAVWETV